MGNPEKRGSKVVYDVFCYVETVSLQKRYFDFWHENPEIESITFELDGDPETDSRTVCVDSCQFVEGGEQAFMSRYAIEDISDIEYSVLCDVYGIHPTQALRIFGLDEPEAGGCVYVARRPDPSSLRDPADGFKEEVLKLLD